MRAGARASLVGAPILAGALLLSSCGGRVPLAATGGRVVTVSGGGTAATSTTTDAGSGSSSTPAAPTGSRADHATSTIQATAPHQVVAAGSAANQSLLMPYEDYLTDLSALDDNLNRAAIGPLASVTTTRLAQASVRQAAALQAAHEHGVGTLRDDQIKVVMTGQDSASLVDCQDEEHFYPVGNGTGTPDPFVARGYFVGSAQMVFQHGRWFVDVFTTTHVTCTF